MIPTKTSLEISESAPHAGDCVFVGAPNHTYQQDYINQYGTPIGELQGRAGTIIGPLQEEGLYRVTVQTERGTAYYAIHELDLTWL